MIRTDSHVDKLGTREFVFSCHNRAFAATWSPLLPKPTETLIDLELVEFLDIPIKKIEARKVSFAGVDTRIVGHISQTIQCVVQGKTSGTIHLKASVVCHLTKMLNMDCVAGGQMYKRLSTTPDKVTSELYSESIFETPKSKKKKEDNSPLSSSSGTPKITSNNSYFSSPNHSNFSSPSSTLRSARHSAWLYQCGCDSRFNAVHDHPIDDRWSFDEEYDMWGLPYNLSAPLVKPESKDNMVTYIMDTEKNMLPFMNVQYDWPEVGQTFPPTLLTPIKKVQSSPIQPQKLPHNPSPDYCHPSTQTSTIKPSESNEKMHSTIPEPTITKPIQTPNPSKSLLLQDLVFCGHYDPCPCLPRLSKQQSSLLPPHYPLYLPQNHLHCGPKCGSHHVHKATSGTCHCAPPTVYQFHDPPDRFWEMFPPNSLSTNPTKPSIQNLTIPTLTSPATEMCDREIERCDYCGQDDDGCKCEDLYFRLQKEQEDIAEL